MKATRESIRLREIADTLPVDDNRRYELHRISGYLEALEDHIERARKALGTERVTRVRKFSLHETGLTHNCNECGRVITPDMPRYFDAVSGHIVHHVECHHKTLTKGAKRV